MTLQHPIRSSMLSSVGYNPETETFIAQFSNGAFYRYNGVPADAFVGVLTNQESHGRAFNKLIKGPFGEGAQKIDAEAAALL